MEETLCEINIISEVKHFSNLVNESTEYSFVVASEGEFKMEFLVLFSVFFPERTVHEGNWVCKVEF